MLIPAAAPELSFLCGRNTGPPEGVDDIVGVEVLVESVLCHRISMLCACASYEEKYEPGSSVGVTPLLIELYTVTLKSLLLTVRAAHLS